MVTCEIVFVWRTVLLGQIKQYDSNYTIWVMINTRREIRIKESSEFITTLENYEFQ